MSIYNDCKIVINLHQLVKERPNGQDLDKGHIDQIANDLRRSLDYGSIYEQVDVAITDYCDDVGIDLTADNSQPFGFIVHEGGKK